METRRLGRTTAARLLLLGLESAGLAIFLVSVPAVMAAEKSSPAAGGKASSYMIEDLSQKTLAAAPGRYYGRCALQELPDGTWFLVYHESGHHFRYEPQSPPTLGGMLHVKFSVDGGQT